MKKIKQTLSTNFFQSESEREKVGRRVLNSTRAVFLFHFLILTSSFLVGMGIASQISQTKAATTYRIATNGNDSNPCTNSQPCLTMNRAYQVASAGDTVEIASGTYGDQTITGTKSSWVYFRPVSGATVRTGTLFAHADYLDIRNIDVDEFKIEANNINDVIIRNVDVHGYLGYSGNNIKRISMYGGSVGPMVNYHPQIAPSNAGSYGAAWATDLLFDGVYWHDMTRNTSAAHTECLQVAGTTRFTMKNSKFERCAIFDLSFTAYNGSGNPTDVLLENNLFATTTGNGSINDGYYALNYGNMQGLVIRNNTFGQGINENTGNQNVQLIGNILSTAWNCLSNTTYRYNVYQWTSNLNCGATDKWVSGPQYSSSNLGFVGSATKADGLKLSSNSPAKDSIPASQAGALGLPSNDIDGQGRPINGVYDAGADEYGTSGANPAPLPAPAPSPTPLPNPAPSPSPSPISVPSEPIPVSGANPDNPVDIPSELEQQDDGTLVADFTGDGVNEVVKDINQDGKIDPKTEIIKPLDISNQETDTASTDKNSNSDQDFNAGKYLDTTSGKLTFAGIFAGLITFATAGAFYAKSHFAIKLLPLSIFRGKGGGSGSGPVDMISG